MTLRVVVEEKELVGWLSIASRLVIASFHDTLPAAASFLISWVRTGEPRDELVLTMRHWVHSTSGTGHCCKAVRMGLE